MRTITRRAPNDARRPRDTLSLRTWRGQDCSKLAAAEQTDDTDTDTTTQLFEAWLWAARNEWSIRARSGVFGSHGKFGKQDAERAWQAMFGKQREHV